MDLNARIRKLELFAEKAGERLTGIETRLVRIETRLDGFASKEDLHKEMNAQTWRIIGGMVAIAGLTLAAAKLFLVQ